MKSDITGGKKRAKLRSQMIRSAIVASAALALALATYFAFVFYPQQMAYARLFLKERNNAINVYIEGYFKEIVNSVGILADNEDVIEADSLGPEARARALSLYARFQAQNRNIYYIYSGYESKMLLINDYEAPEGYDPRNRPWYRAAMDAAPGTDMVVGLLYREAKSNELLLSTVRVLRTPERVTGVFAIDSYTQAIAEQLTRRSSFFATSYSFIADSRWEIIVHPDPGFVGVDARTVAGGFAAVDDGEFVEYRLEGNPKLAYVSRVPLTGWYLVTTVDEADITGPTFRDLAFYLGFILLIVTGFGIVNATVWGRRYMDPLLALRDRVREIVRSGSSTTAAVFPDNEVGEIATTVESMAGDALISKNRELEAANAQITRMNAELALKNSELEVLATHDYLTGVFNRRKIEQALAVEHSKFERYGTPYSMMIIDLDHFKTVNDEYGHREGDDVLIRLGEAFRGRLRKSDMLGRWGGEEFMVLLANTTLPDAAEAAEKMRIVAAELDLGLPRNVTISVGVGEVKAGESSDGFIRRVDTLLYEAKERGRDRVISG